MHGGYAFTPIARPDGLGLLRSPGGIRDKRKRASADAAELGSSPGPPGAEMRSSNPMHLIGGTPPKYKIGIGTQCAESSDTRHRLRFEAERFPRKVGSFVKKAAAPLGTTAAETFDLLKLCSSFTQFRVWLHPHLPPDL